MNSMSGGSRLMATVLCVALLAGCDSIKDVRTDPTTPLPPASVVVQGTITGLGSLRSVVLINNGDNTAPASFAAPPPAVPNAPAPVVPFSFGSQPSGNPYNITIRQQPYGKTCTVTNGTGTLVAGVSTNITINCVNSVTRYNLTVNLNQAFATAAGAKVTLTTEEAIYELPAAGAASVTFNNVVFNAASNAIPAPPAGAAAFTWIVTATTATGGTLNQCAVSNSTGTNPTANVTTPTVGACTFTISGALSYSRPPGVTADPVLGAGGVTLELRNVRGEVKATQNITAYGGFSFGGTATPTQFSSTTDSVYDVVVASHPAGQYCVVGDGGAASLYVVPVVAPTATSVLNPSNITATGTTAPGAVTPAGGVTPLIPGTRLTVFCRNRPASANNTLTGTYRLTKTTANYVTGGTNATSSTTIEYKPFDLTVQNTASSNVISFFDDGTFLYGTHANSTQIEHGFYDYDANAGTLRFTMHTDTATGVTFPVGNAFDPRPVQNQGSPYSTATAGLSATPGSLCTTASGAVACTTVNPAAGGVTRHAAMCNVVKVPGSNPGKVTGSFGGAATFAASGTTFVSTTTSTCGGAILPPAGGTGATAVVTAATRVDWELTEPVNTATRLEGSWVSQDHRRSFVYDDRNYFAFHVGVAGGAANLQDVCIALDNAAESSSFYIARAVTTCLPWNRPAAQPVAQFYGGPTANIEITDTMVPAVTLLPGFVGRLPGAVAVVNATRSPSPAYYTVAPPGNFFTVAPTTYFQAAPTSWCTTELLGIRATTNGNPIDQPVYFCRYRAN
jgi:hypothetical protein